MTNYCLRFTCRRKFAYDDSVICCVCVKYFDFIVKIVVLAVCHIYVLRLYAAASRAPVFKETVVLAIWVHMYVCELLIDRLSVLYCIVAVKHWISTTKNNRFLCTVIALPTVISSKLS